MQQPDLTVQAAPEPAELHLVRRDDAASFDAFYTASRDRVGRALALTLRDRDLAADAVDEAMARAYQRWDRVRTLDNPGGWVYRVGLNYARSRIRRMTRRLADARRPHDLPLHEPSVLRALDRLSVDHRSVVVCRLLLGWSEAETAAALHIKAGTAKSRLHRALAALENELDHLRPEGPR